MYQLQGKINFRSVLPFYKVLAITIHLEETESYCMVTLPVPEVTRLLPVKVSILFADELDPLELEIVMFCEVLL